MLVRFRSRIWGTLAITLPISEFKLQSEDYLKIGARIAALARPTLFVMEGGYAVAEIGVNTVNVLLGFEGG